MSRVGKMPITLPSGVNLAVENDVITVTGPKGTLSTPLLGGTSIKTEDTTVTVSNIGSEAVHRANHGLMRTLTDNMVIGVTQGFSKQLEITGVGYRVAKSGAGLKFNLGFSHDIQYDLPQGITAAVEQNIITISGINKQQVGQVAAEIRALKKPEPYKGKGIKYVGERIIRKSGKSGKEK